MTHIDFSPDERMHYDYVDRKAQARFNKYMQQGTVMKHYSSVLVLLLRLRQSCLHPSLTLTEGDSDVVPEEDNSEQQLEVARSMSEDVVRRLLNESATLAEIECPICMDIAQNAQILKGCGHILCKECLDSYINTNDGGPKRCPQCRGDLSRQNLIPIESFIKIHAPQLIEEAAALENEDEEDKKKEKEAIEKVQEFVSSAKIDKMIEILEETRAITNNKDKTIVFSQFTSFVSFESSIFF
jgi:SNF2 family DNA or RNA helicase